MTRPLIGVTTELGAAAWRDRIREAALSPAAYSRAIERAGAVPVLLPPVLPSAAARLAAGLDGLMFCGGADIGARWYGQAPDSLAEMADHARDAFEIALMRAALEAGVPFLAISRGLQVLNVAAGGTLVPPPADAEPADPAASDPAALPAQKAPQPLAPRAQSAGKAPNAQPAVREVRLLTSDGRRPGCEVRISADSRLGHILGVTATVSAGRHQFLEQLGAGLTAVAWADDEMVAAVEVAGHRFGIGVRWHPEESDDMRIFEEFRAAASSTRQVQAAVP